VADLRADLARWAEEVRETHISWVFLRQQDVLKVKKPVSFGFLDFSSLEQRRQACLTEVELNARLAPGVYLGVVPVLRTPTGEHSFALDDDPAAVMAAGTTKVTAETTTEIVDWAVHMRRLPDRDRADVRLQEGRLSAGQLEKLAEALSRFHAAAASSPRVAAFGHVAAIRDNVRENFDQAHQRLAGLVSAAQQREVESWQLSFLEQHSELFEQRVRSGHVRDGHGDLRLEHVYIDEQDQPLVIDCIEFNERFRYGDTCADIAFLSMDLAFHERVDLAERFLAAYAKSSKDHDLYALVDFYESYRAYVRAKISALGLDAAALAARQELERQARRYLLLALASKRPFDGPPRLLALAGMIASGKSTLAAALAGELPAVQLSSDRLRKELLGITADTPVREAAFAEHYSESASEGVYAELLRRAELVLRSGRSVVLDASFRSSAARAAARALAARCEAPFTLIECRVPPEVCRARLAERALAPSESDGRAQIFDDFALHYEPISELSEREHVVLDTSGTPAESLVRLRRAAVV
jgi:aminoglycoside phosphotransferase family enzyme/predicted kinase